VKITGETIAWRKGVDSRIRGNDSGIDTYQTDDLSWISACAGMTVEEIR